ncbi:MAG: PAS domain-containing protein [Burkholderiales bacterium]
MPLTTDTENSNWNLSQVIVDQTSEAIIFADREGAIRLWNNGAEMIFGYSAAEVMGQSLDVIIPEHLRKAHWNGFRRSIDSAITKYSGQVLTTRSTHKNGSKLYVDLSFCLIKDPTGWITGALAIGRDCTTRHQADTALRRRVAELEEKLKHTPTLDNG